MNIRRFFKLSCQETIILKNFPRDHPQTVLMHMHDDLGMRKVSPPIAYTWTETDNDFSKWQRLFLENRDWRLKMRHEFIAGTRLPKEDR